MADDDKIGRFVREKEKRLNEAHDKKIEVE